MKNEEKQEKERVIKLKEEGTMKNQIITLIIGILIGAIVTSAIFLIVKPKNTRRMPDFSNIEKNGERIRPNGGNTNREGKTRDKDNSKSEKKDDATKDNMNEGQA